MMWTGISKDSDLYHWKFTMKNDNYLKKLGGNNYENKYKKISFKFPTIGDWATIASNNTNYRLANSARYDINNVIHYNNFK